jgi:hypothetical protein
MGFLPPGTLTTGVPITKLVEKHSGGEVIMDDIRKELFGE